jgi:hypothetical protein
MLKSQRGGCLGDLVRTPVLANTLLVAVLLGAAYGSTVGAAEANLTAPGNSGGGKQKYRAPRTEYGQPELRGVWNFSSDEGNYGLGNLLSGERQAERERAAKQ